MIHASSASRNCARSVFAILLGAVLGLASFQCAQPEALKNDSPILTGAAGSGAAGSTGAAGTTPTGTAGTTSTAQAPPVAHRRPQRHHR